MTEYDWGERQKRAEYLISLLSTDPDKTAHLPYANYTYRELIDHIDKGTMLGHEVVAVAGLVLYAMSRDEKLRESIQRRKTDR